MYMSPLQVSASLKASLSYSTALECDVMARNELEYDEYLMCLTSCPSCGVIVLKGLSSLSIELKSYKLIE
jgi:hypothetical protein